MAEFYSGLTQTMAMHVKVKNALMVVAVSAIVYQVIKFLWNVVWYPLRLRRIMEKQGVRGPRFRFLVGNLMEANAFSESFPDALPLDNYANLSPTVTPHYALYFPKYGKNFVYHWGTMTRLAVGDPDIVKELLITNHESLIRAPLDEKIVSELLGKGLLSQLGDKWIKERRTLHPFFHQDALKGMVEAMVEAIATEIHKWEETVAQQGGSAEIDVEIDMHKISGRIISRTAFGDDFVKGEQIFRLQAELAQELSNSFRIPAYWLIPNYRKFPTKGNKIMDQCTAKVDALLHETIYSRRETLRNGGSSDDLLGRMLMAATESWDEKALEFNLASVLNNCKLFYFAGQDTVANVANFAMLMLAVYPEWQDRARKEVLDVLGDKDNYNANVLSRLKVIGMVINETLRIFPPGVGLTRVAAEDIQLKRLFIPKGMIIEFATTVLHQDKEYWGEDVGEFNPERFTSGVAGACTHPQAFMPFGTGPKFCIGNNFALMEAKIVLSMVLRRFHLVPSPNYKHHPTFTMVQKPKYGLPIILKAL